MPSIPEPAEEVVVSKPARPLSAFKRLSPRVGLYEPPPTSLKPSANSPTTILFCAWMNAAPKHIDYYTRTYMKLYPAARMILVTINTTEFMFQSEVRRRADIREAVKAILAPDQAAERLVVHSISNGGAKRFYGIAGEYKSLTGKLLPVKGYILDSAPGIPQFRRDIHALTLPARNLNWFFWIPFYVATLFSVSAVFVSVNWMPRWFWKELVWAPTDLLNDITFLDKDCVRGYIYSKDDLAIDWKNVEAHAKIAEGNGYRVLKKRVESAGHAVMFKGKGGENDYWGWVAKIWEMGIGLQ